MVRVNGRTWVCLYDKNVESSSRARNHGSAARSTRDVIRGSGARPLLMQAIDVHLPDWFGPFLPICMVESF